MGTHIVNGTFKSDKYPDCPEGKVPLSVEDRSAQPFLWGYAQVHRTIDAEFSDDLEEVLRAKGYTPPTEGAAPLDQSGELAAAEAEIARLRALIDAGTSRAQPIQMTIERAKEITAQCLHNRMFTTVGLGEKTPLPDCSLEEMLLANRMVSQHKEPEVTAPDGTKSRTTLMTVDPRGIAVAYALQAFGGSPYALLDAAGFTLKTKGDDDVTDDEEEEG